jgi:2-iminobutanoate/2-iminopropanoate deaminase
MLGFLSQRVSCVVDRLDASQLEYPAESVILRSTIHCSEDSSMNVETSTPPNTPTPIGPYNHIARAGQFISIGGTAGVNPGTGQLAGADVYAQTAQILDSFAVMLASVGSDLRHVLHINIFLKDVRDFEEMNRAYVEKMGNYLPARTVIGVNELPKPGALLTMNLTAVTNDGE